MIMVSHNIVHDIDDEYPSSISKKVHDLLRNEYKYTGLIATDSLSMGAITKYTKDVSPAVLAVLAGNDIIVTSTFEQHINELIKGVENNEVDMSLIEKAAKRVIAWKLKYIYKREKEKSETKINWKIILFISIGIGIFGIIFLIICLIYKCKNSKKKENDENEQGLIENNNYSQRDSE